MSERPDDQNQWTDEQWAEFRLLLRRHKQLVSDLIHLTIQKSGGFSDGHCYIGLGTFEPGHGSIMVDGDLSFQDVKVLLALLELPDTSYSTTIEEFDWAKFEGIRDALKKDVVALGLEPNLPEVDG